MKRQFHALEFVAVVKLSCHQPYLLCLLHTFSAQLRFSRGKEQCAGLPPAPPNLHISLRKKAAFAQVQNMFKHVYVAHGPACCVM